MPNHATASDLPQCLSPTKSSTISLSHKKFPFQKSLMTSLHVIFGLASPPIKNPGFAYARGMAFRAVSPQITA